MLTYNLSPKEISEHDNMFDDVIKLKENQKIKLNPQRLRVLLLLTTNSSANPEN